MPLGINEGFPKKKKVGTLQESEWSIDRKDDNKREYKITGNTPPDNRFVEEFFDKQDVLEEEQRVNRNDPGMDKKKGSGGVFIPKEKLSDSNNEDDIINKIDEGKEKSEENKRKGWYSRKENNEKQKKIEKLKNEIIGYREGDGAAHVGPEFYKNEKSENKIIANNNIEEKVAEEETGSNPSSNTVVSPLRGKINEFLHGYISRRTKKDSSKVETIRTIYGEEKKIIPNMKFGKGKDNLKTISKSKRERSSRGDIREVLHDPNKIDY
jgi:hypothetical protein